MYRTQATDLIWIWHLGRYKKLMPLSQVRSGALTHLPTCHTHPPYCHTHTPPRPRRMVLPPLSRPQALVLTHTVIEIGGDDAAPLHKPHTSSELAA